MSLLTGTFGNSSAFIADQASITRDTGRQIEWASVPFRFRVGAVKVTLAAAIVATNTSITVLALPAAIPAGTVISIGTQMLLTTAAAALGATTIAIQAAPGATANSTVGYTFLNTPKLLPAGTVLAAAPIDAGKVIPRVDNSTPAIGILETDAWEGERSAALTGYGVIKGGMIFENMTATGRENGGTLASQIKTELNAIGTGFGFSIYANSAAA